MSRESMAEGSESVEDELNLGGVRSEGSDWNFDEIKKAAETATKANNTQSLNKNTSTVATPGVSQQITTQAISELTPETIVRAAAEAQAHPRRPEDVMRDRSAIEGGVNVMGGGGTPTRPEVNRRMLRIERGRFSTFDPVDLDSIQQAIEQLTDAAGNPISDQEKYDLTRSVIARSLLQEGFAAWNNAANFWSQGNREKFEEQMITFQFRRAVFAGADPELRDLILNTPGVQEALDRMRGITAISGTTTATNYFKSEAGYDPRILADLSGLFSGDDLSARTALNLAKKYLIVTEESVKYGGNKLRRVLVPDVKAKTDAIKGVGTTFLTSLGEWFAKNVKL